MKKEKEKLGSHLHGCNPNSSGLRSLSRTGNGKEEGDGNGSVARILPPVSSEQGVVIGDAETWRLVAWRRAGPGVCGPHPGLKGQ